MIAVMLTLVVVPGAIADLLTSAGMKRHGEITEFGLRGLLSACRSVATNRLVLAGIPAMAVSFFALMALLSVTEMSVAVPLTATSYILETALARYVLDEDVGWRRWTGAALVAAGVALLSA